MDCKDMGLPSISLEHLATLYYALPPVPAKIHWELGPRALFSLRGLRDGSGRYVVEQDCYYRFWLMGLAVEVVFDSLDTIRIVDTEGHVLTDASSSSDSLAPAP
jgi:hypothetical protein